MIDPKPHHSATNVDGDRWGAFLKATKAEADHLPGGWCPDWTAIAEENWRFGFTPGHAVESIEIAEGLRHD